MGEAPWPDLRTVEQLLDATGSAPTFGLNARELILQAARLIAQEDDAKGTSTQAAQRAQANKGLLAAIFREGPALLQALPKEQRPLVPFRAIHRSKVPRVSRQVVLERLAGQHLALALHQAGLEVTAASLANFQQQIGEALAAAVAQEEELYQRGKASKAVYLNYAARCNAGLWGQPADPEPAAPKSKEAAAPAKRQKLSQEPGGLVEADIDWDNLPPAQPSPPREPEPTAQPEGTARESGASVPAGKAAERPQAAPKSSIARPVLRLQPAPAAQPSAEGLEEYSPSRHGGESPPAGPPASPPPPQAAAGPAAAAREAGGGGQEGRRRAGAAQPPGDPAVVAALVQFLRTHLEPLFQAKVISKAVYKKSMQGTVEKVMASHRDDRDARFLVREGGRVTRLLQQLIEREQAREAAA